MPSQNTIRTVTVRGQSAGLDKLAADLDRVAVAQGRLAEASAAAARVTETSSRRQLSSGQSPFLIATQQGSQIAQVLGGAGAGGAVKALGGAFLSLVSPVNLLSIAAIAFGGTLRRGKSAAEAFENALSRVLNRLVDMTLNSLTGSAPAVAGSFGKVAPTVKVREY
jgi:hypothetical protein